MGRDDYFVFGMNYSVQVILLLHLQPQVGVECILPGLAEGFKVLQPSHIPFVEHIEEGFIHVGHTNP